MGLFPDKRTIQFTTRSNEKIELFKQITKLEIFADYFLEIATISAWLHVASQWYSLGYKWAIHGSLHTIYQE